MYDITGKFLYEILDDYQCADSDDEKQDVFKAFCKGLWSIKNQRQTYTKNITYAIIDNDNSIYSNVFNMYKSVSYTAYNSTTKNQAAWFLLRQKINNIYTNMCDNSVCTKKDYLELLHMPKKLYFRYIQNKLDMTADELETELDTALTKAQDLFEMYSKQKMNISWKKYKKLIEGYLHKIFDNYICLDDFEDKTKLVMDINYWSEDNYVVKYIGKSLNGYMRNYQKEYYGFYMLNQRDKRKYQRCLKCGKLFLIKNSQNKYCDECQKYQPMEIKTIQCVDCGSDVIVKAWNMKTKRCLNCQHEYIKVYDRLRKNNQNSV